jgi:hypothetical protein
MAVQYQKRRLLCMIMAFCKNWRVEMVLLYDNRTLRVTSWTHWIFVMFFVSFCSSFLVRDASGEIVDYYHKAINTAIFQPLFPTFRLPLRRNRLTACVKFEAKSSAALLLHCMYFVASYENISCTGYNINSDPATGWVENCEEFGLSKRI